MAAQKLLSTVFRLKSERRQRFGAGQSIDILLGKQTTKVTQFNHDSLSVFGIGTELSDGEWRGVVRQLLAQGLLAVQGEYQTLALTAASAEVLRSQRQVMLRQDAPPPKAARSSRGPGGGPAAGRTARRSGRLRRRRVLPEHDLPLTA